VKVWTAAQGACFVTFKEHTGPVSAVCFAPSGHAVLSASLDGTVRAYDLVRYRNFRTLTAPTPCQFASLAIDPSGEVVAAGCADTFAICVWALKTGRLLDVLSGHEAPVISLSFSPAGSLLASGSWDKTVRLWDVFEGGRGAVEALPHGHDVLAVAFRPDGKQLASAALDGQLFFWAAADGVLQGTIEGRRDAAGGRARADRRTAASASHGGKAFCSLAYSADGALLLAAGNSKFVCMYDVAQRVLLRRYQISHNRSMDGVLDVLDSRRMTEAGPVELLPRGDSEDDADQEDDFSGRRRKGGALPGAGAAGGAAGGAAARGAGARPAARVKAVRLSPSGQSFAAATPEGVLLFSLDREGVFDPSDLGEDVTPAAAHAALAAGAHARALLLSLRLNDAPLLRAVLERTPPAALRAAVAAAPATYLARLLAALAEAAESSPHVEHVLAWVVALCHAHGRAMQERAASLLPACRALTRQLARLHEDLGATAGGNVYALRFLCTAPADAGADGDADAVLQLAADVADAEEEEDESEEEP
jgi:periodic tryptophan protein 2